MPTGIHWLVNLIKLGLWVHSNITNVFLPLKILLWIKLANFGPREMCQLLNFWSQVQIQTHYVAHNQLLTTVPGDWAPFSDLFLHPHTCGIHNLTQAHICTHTNYQKHCKNNLTTPEDARILIKNLILHQLHLPTRNCTSQTMHKMVVGPEKVNLPSQHILEGKFLSNTRKEKTDFLQLVVSSIVNYFSHIYIHMCTFTHIPDLHGLAIVLACLINNLSWLHWFVSGHHAQ